MKKINRNIYGAMLFCAMANQSHGLQNNSYCSPYNSLRVMAPNFYPKPNNRGNFRQQAHRPQQYGQLPPLSQGQYQNQGSKNDPYNPSGAMVPNFYPQTNVADGNNFWQPNYPQQQVSKSLYGQLPPLSQGQYQNQGSKNDPYNPSGAMVPNFYPQTNAAGGNFRQPNYPQRQVGQSLYGQLPSLSQVQYQNQGSKNDPYNPSVAMASNFYPQTNAKDRYTPNGAYLPHDLQPIDDSLRNFPSIYRPLKIELTEREKAILGGVGNFYGFLCGIYNKTSGKEYNSLTS
ncbi:MAG: hypothetical protein LBI77_02225, partial [Puniceicoccales bacterium]|nr:hypothetical protein [Puniceicoccales bacterium]